MTGSSPQPDAENTGKSEADSSDEDVATDEFEEGVSFPGFGADEGDSASKSRGRSKAKLSPVRDENDVAMQKQKQELEGAYRNMIHDGMDRQATTALRKSYGTTLLVVLGLQLGIVDLIFYLFLQGNNYKISDAVMIAFLSSVVVEVIGLVAIVVNSLFKNEAAKQAHDKQALREAATTLGE